MAKETRFLSIFIITIMLLGLFVGLVTDFMYHEQSLVDKTYEDADLSWKIAAVLTTAGLGDDSFNDQVYQGLIDAKNKWRIDFEYSEPSTIGEYESHFRSFLENPSYSEPYDLIIAVGGDQVSVVESVAGDYPSQYFAIFDTYVNSGTYPNVASLQFDVAEGSALVGVMAGLMTVADDLAFIGGMNIPLVNAYKNGFVYGADYYNPSLTHTTSYTNSWVDQSAAEALADAHYASGTDIIYTFTGAANGGVYTSAKDLNGTGGYDDPLWVIGSNTPQMHMGCSDPGNPIFPTVGLTSMIKNATSGTLSIISHVLEGTFSGGIKAQNVETNGVHVELQPELLQIPQYVLDNVTDFRKGIINGSITVPGSIGGASLTEEDVTGYKPINFRTITKDMNMTTFASPDGSKDTLWKFLNSAKESIYVEIYGINHPHILNLIHEIHDTKPWIDMKFLIGGNSLGYTSQNDYVANNLTLLGYPVKWTSNSDFTFAHQKFVVIDNKTTIVHAGNWAKTSFPDYQYKANREWSIAMTDTDVADCYLSVFHKDWSRGINYNATLHGTGTPLTDPTTPSTYSHPFATAGEFSGVTSVTPIFSPETSLDGILWCINQSRFTLDIQIPYFTSVGDGGEVDEVIDAILAAKDRGVTVRVISDEEKDWALIEQILVDHGIPIVWMDIRWFTANHNKGIIVDGATVLVSSINYSDGSIGSNREAGVIIQHEGVAKWFQEIYDFDWGMADADGMEEVNLYWTPNIPTSTNTTNVTVYTQQLYSDVDEVILSVKIGGGAWTNHTITSNVYPSAEGQLENYYYEIAPQPHGTKIVVQAYVQALGVWHTGVNMTIHVLNTIYDYVDIDYHPDVEYEEGYTGSFINWTATALTPDSYIIYEDESEIASEVWDGSGIDVPVDGLSAGIHNYTLFANNTHGDSDINTVWVTVFLDENPVITGPGDFAIEFGVQGVNVSWIIEESTPQSYEVYTSETLDSSGAWNISPATIEVTLDGLELGSWNYTILVTDSIGNTAVDTVWITVSDTTDPFISGPSDFGIEVGSMDVEVSWTIQDQNPQSYEIFRNNTSLISGPWSISPDTVDSVLDGLGLGYWNFTLYVEDGVGNSASDTVWVTVNDTVAPVFTGIPLGFTYEYGASPADLVWYMSDLTLDGYAIYLDHVIDITGDLTATADSVSFGIAGLSLGEHNITVVAFDVTGNSTAHTVIVTFVDTTSPTISSPDDMVMVEGETGHSINWIGTDLLPSQYEIYLDGISIKSGLWNSSSETISHLLDGLTMGTYSFRINITDAGGNSITDTVVVTVEGQTSVVTTTTTTTTTTDTNTTTSDTTTETEGEPLTTEQIILVVAGAIVVLIGVFCGAKKKR
ncbi:MAG: BMP family ABC transporter substrate-binding protein [Candidatus Thorarchaeota archaeon]